MKKVNVIILSIAIALVLIIAEIFLVKFGTKYEVQVDIVYASTNIEAKTIIKPEMLELRRVNYSIAHSDSFKSINDLVGKKAKYPVFKDEQVLSNRIGKSDEMEELSLKDPNNKFFSLEFKGDQANGWWLMVDQFVDLIFIPNEKPKMPGQNNSPINVFPDKQVDLSGAEITTATLISVVKAAYLDISNVETSTDSYKIVQHVRIAALIDDKGKQLTNKEREVLPKWVSLEVNNEQAVFLCKAKSYGRVEIASLMTPEEKK